MLNSDFTPIPRDKLAGEGNALRLQLWLFQLTDDKTRRRRPVSSLAEET